jgi:nucleoid-associated protein YgaU
MKKLALIYLALILAMTAGITGLPFKVMAWLQGVGVQTAAVDTPAAPPAVEPEVVAMAAPSPSTLSQPAAVATAQPITETGAAGLIASAEPAALPGGALTKPVVRGGDASLDQTTSAILSELAILPAASLPAADAEMLAMSNTALTGLRALRGDAAGPAPATLERLVADALRAGQTDAYIDVLVNEAAGQGAISVPSALVTADGRVDTAVLLASIVAKAQVAAGTIQPVNPADVVAGGEGVEVRVVAQAMGESAENQFYTVAPGDSLGSIAQKFYGDAVYFPAIFEANRALLASPDRLNVGQRLVVPAANTL